jgi:hypothetical protein
MTVGRFLKPGEAEMLKGSVHAAACGLALVCGVYNAAAWLTRRERHLGVNAVLYAGLAIWEATHVRRHCQRGLKERSTPAFLARQGAPGDTPLKPAPVPTPEWVDSPFAGASIAGHAELAS